MLDLIHPLPLTIRRVMIATVAALIRSTCTRALLLSVILGSHCWADEARVLDRPSGLPRTSPESLAIAPESVDAIDEIVEKGIDEGKMPGAVVLIGHRGSIIFHRAYGQRQTVPEPLPMELDTVFDLASLTKPIATATSVMILVQRGEIALDDPVAKYLPEFASHGKDKVTVQDLLLHVGGLVPDNAMSDYENGVESSLRNLMDVELNYEPGERFRYSDVGFLVLGELVRRVSGQGLDEFAHANIFVPLGMTETGYLPEEPLRQRAATTEQRDGRWMRGEVHDPRAYALGGIAGHAGLFSTASDLALYAQMMANRGTLDGQRILQEETFERMTAAYDVPGGKRGLGWDKRSGYSSNRGKSMTDAAFGHGGFTGTAMWIDPELDLFVIFLSNRVHPRGKGSVNALAGEIATIAADAVIAARERDASLAHSAEGPVLCGIDVLQRDQFAPLDGAKVGLITNHTGVGRQGESTAELMHASPHVEVVALFSPEHGIAGQLDQSEIADVVDPRTGLKVFSLYGRDRKPSVESLQGIDTLVFDIQDIGTRFYTYISTMGGAMEVAEEQGLRFVVLDRPNPINGVDVGGPVLDDGSQSFVGYHTLPVRHGMTVGELATMFKAERFPTLDLEIIACEGWNREMYYDKTGLYWIDPSPNMRNLNQAILYPGVGLLEYTNLSVGRGTDTPFEHFGAPWMDAGRVAFELDRLKLPGVVFIPERFTPTTSKYENQECGGVQILITDRGRIDPIKTGLAIALTLRHVHPEQWDMKPFARLLSSSATFDAVEATKPLDQVIEIAETGLDAFLDRRSEHLIYGAESRP